MSKYTVRLAGSDFAVESTKEVCTSAANTFRGASELDHAEAIAGAITDVLLMGRTIEFANYTLARAVCLFFAQLDEFSESVGEQEKEFLLAASNLREALKSKSDILAERRIR